MIVGVGFILINFFPEFVVSQNRGLGEMGRENFDLCNVISMVVC